MSDLRLKPPGKRNISVALTDNELKVLQFFGYQPRANFIAHVRASPQDFESMKQISFETMVREAAPIAPPHVARLIVLRFLRIAGALDSIPAMRADFVWVLFMAAGWRWRSAPRRPTQGEEKRPHFITIPLSGSERTALTQVAIERAGNASPHPSVVAREQISQFVAMFQERVEREFAAAAKLASAENVKRLAA